MSEPKTKPTDASVVDYLNAIENEQVRMDCFTIMEIMQEAAKAKPQMWGDSIVGFGSYHYVGKSGREGDWPIIGFSARKQNITLYFMTGFDQYDGLLRNLGKYTTGKACLYIKRLSDIDIPTLKQLIQASIDQMMKTYKTT
jgi:hypothetical protein